MKRKNRPPRKLWVVTPVSIDKNYGGAIMQECAGKHPEDWILIRDGDMCFLTSDWVQQVHEIIERHGEAYQIIGAMTNRLNLPQQLHGGVVSSIWDMREHSLIAQKRQAQHRTEIIPVEEVAAVCMIMQVKTLLAIQMIEHDIYFDRKFCASARYHGLNIGVATGLYCFHAYRMWSSDPGKDIKHLLP